MAYCCIVMKQARSKSIRVLSQFSSCAPTYYLLLLTISSEGAFGVLCSAAYGQLSEPMVISWRQFRDIVLTDEGVGDAQPQVEKFLLKAETDDTLADLALHEDDTIAMQASWRLCVLELKDRFKITDYREERRVRVGRHIGLISGRLRVPLPDNWQRTLESVEVLWPVTPFKMRPYSDCTLDEQLS